MYQVYGSLARTTAAEHPLCSHPQIIKSNN